jgi:hypothetical protein
MEKQSCKKGIAMQPKSPLLTQDLRLNSKKIGCPVHMGLSFGLLLALWVIPAGCSKDEGADPGKTGGVAKTGGAKSGGAKSGGNTAGATSAGGASAGGNMAGASSAGGATSSGGVTSASGGTPSLGGSLASDAATTVNDAAAMDGATSTGGSVAPSGDGGIGTALIGYWALDEANPDDVCMDSSGNHYDGTPKASPLRGEGKFGLHGLNLNPNVSEIDPTHDQFVGCAQKIDLATTMPAPSAPFSISAWVRPKMIMARQYIVAFTGETEMALFIEKSGELRYWRWDPKPPGEVKHPSEGIKGVAPVAGAWTHVVVTIGPSVAVGSTEANQRLYVNGTLAASYAGGSGTFTTGTWHIGAKGSLQFCLSGDIDEVRVFGQVLTPEEVQKLFTTNAL